MGQWIQDGERTIFETVISVEATDHSVLVPTDEADLDGLNFLAGKHVDEVNKMAELGTQLAHVDGGVPNIKVTMPEVSAFYIGQCSISSRKLVASVVICWALTHSINRVSRLIRRICSPC